MNSTKCTGRLTADVELKSTPSGVSVCQFTIAVKRPHVKDTTDFFRCVAWRNTAEFIAKYFGKGKMILIEGYLTTREWDDQNGVKRYATEIVVDNAEFCGDKSNDSKPAAAEPNVPAEQPQYEEIDDDDLPFD